MKRLLVALGVAAALLGPAGAARGQWMRLEGRVQWIAGEKMMLLPYGGLPVNVDLGQVPLSQYATLTQGSAIVVIGVVSSDGRRLIATGIGPGGGWSGESP